MEKTEIVMKGIWEKMYNEALERARKLKEMYPQDAPGYEEVFPELRESEDERIKKKLIEIIGYFRSRGIDQQLCEEFLAYLEKQKYDRMQPIYDSIDSFESALDKAWKAYNDSGARTVDGCEDDYVECAHAKGFREGSLYGLEKQKEQKPAEKPSTLELLRQHLADTPSEQLDAEFEALKEYTTDKPAGWSEEDERIRKAILGFLNPDKGGTKYSSNAELVEWSDWLKSLRPQPKVELSEDVKKTLDEVSHILIGLNYTQVAKDYKQAVEKLLYSRPSWKPSEEQMRVLKQVEDCVAMKSGYWEQVLDSLYLDLKKL